ELLGASDAGLIPKRRAISGVNRVRVAPVSSSSVTGSWWLSTACTNTVWRMVANGTALPTTVGTGAVVARVARGGAAACLWVNAGGCDGKERSINRSTGWQ